MSRSSLTRRNDPAENRLGKGREEDGERTEGKKERERVLN